MKNNELKTTIKRAIKDMVKELGLKQYPTIKIESDDSNYIMAATGVLYTRGGLFDRTITKTESDYVLHINKKALSRTLKSYTLVFGNKQARYDCVYLLVCHELRHMWQYQEGFLIGSKHDTMNINEMFNGHGSDPVEVDANNWMIHIAEQKGIKDLAVYMELEQRADGLSNRFDKEFHANAVIAYKDTLKHYNKMLYFIIKVLKR